MYFKIVKYYPKNKLGLIQLLEIIEPAYSTSTNDLIINFPFNVNLNNTLYISIIHKYHYCTSALIRINSIIIIKKIRL